MVLRLVRLGEYLLNVMPSCLVVQGESVLESLHELLKVDFSILIFIQVIKLNQVL